jgi:ABC-type branched-subunit amino acid transport system ATPase component
LSAEAGSGAATLAVRGLTAGYSAQPVITDIDLTALPGEVVAVVGPNGAGKSTLLRSLMGELRVFAGRVLLDDREITGLRADRLVRQGIGYVPQLDPIFPTLTVTENLEVGGYLLNRAAVRRRIQDVLELLPELATMRSRTAVTLSGGEKRMLGIATVLMLQPRLMLLDEPTANLSPLMARRILGSYVPQIALAGTTVLLVEQRVREAFGCADRAYVLVAGRNSLSGPADELARRADIGSIFLGDSRGSTGAGADGPCAAADFAG